MAPVLSFTAEELWHSIPERQREADSVHLTAFPQANPRYRDMEMEKRWEQLLNVRSKVQAELENKRREKLIGAPLEAKVLIDANPEKYDLLKRYEQYEDLPGLFIVSQVELKKVTHLPPYSDFEVKVLKAEGNKCVRCWRYQTSVGANAAHPEVCDRCVEAIA